MKRLSLILSSLLMAVSALAIPPTQSAIQTAINNASPGDTIILDAGTPAAWTSGVVINKPVTIIGAGMGNTVITRNGTSFTLQTARNVGNDDVPYIRLSGLTIQGIAGAGSNAAGFIIVKGDAHKFRIDHVEVTTVTVSTPIAIDGPWGVVDHCKFNLPDNAQFFVRQSNWNGIVGWGDGSWADSPHWATEQFPYIEDCTFTGPDHLNIDGDSGSRYVFRHNRATGLIAGHGTESTHRKRGTRAIEIYNNIFDRTNPPTQTNDKPVQVLAGAWTVFNNVFVGFNNPPAIYNNPGGTPRTTTPFSPWGLVSGDNNWDDNDPTPVQSGNTSAANSGLTVQVPVTGSPGQDVYKGYAIHKVGAGQQDGSYITGNTAVNAGKITVTYAPVVTGYGWNNLTFASGAAFEIRKVRSILDGPGRGQGDLLSGGDDNSNPTNQARGGALWPRNKDGVPPNEEGIYSWNNHLSTIGGTTENGFTASTTTGYTLSGRELFAGTIRPSYPNIGGPSTAAKRVGPDNDNTTQLVGSTQVYGFQYPHPLVSGVAPSPTISNAPTTTFSVGTAGSFTVTTSNFSGNPTIVKSGAALPSGVTFTDNGNGTGTLAGTPTTASGSPYAITFTATYTPPTPDEVATQNFTLLVTNPNNAPTVSLTSPTAGATYTAPATILLTASANDSDGSISKVEFYRTGLGSPLATVNAPGPYTFTWTGAVAASYTLTAKAYDNLNASTTSSGVAITVNSAAPTPTPPAQIIVRP